MRGAEVGSDDLVVEIGAGGGRLTAELARRAREVRAIEIDPAWVAELRARFGRVANVVIVEGDALATPLPGEPFRVLTNPPFNRTTDVLRRLLDNPATPLRRADLLLEWDVACKRARVAPSTVLGVVWQARYEFGVVRRLHPSAFAPPAAVDVGLLRIVAREQPLVPAAETEAFRRLVRDTFAGGLALRRALRGKLPPRQLKGLARAHGFAADAVPSELDVHQWAAIHRAVRGVR